MSWRTTGILFVILLAVAGFAVWQGRNRTDEAAEELVPPSAEQSEVIPFFPDVDPGQVKRFVVVDEASGAAVAFQFDANGWRQTEPADGTLAAEQINNAVNALLQLRSRRSFSADQNPLSDYGLEEPAYAITLDVARGETKVRHVVNVGNLTPAGDGQYVQRVGDGRVYIVLPTALQPALDLLSRTSE